MPRSIQALLVVFVPLATASLLTSKSSGVLPGELLVPVPLTSAFPACGQCHDQFPNANGRVKMTIKPSALSLAANASINVDVKVTGGPATTSGGFAMESDRGAFVAGLNSRTTPAGDAITHTDKFGDSWTFGFKAPATPGPVQWTGATQKANLDLTPAGDSFGFWGPNSDNPGVPLRLYVNASGVVPYGRGCAGTDEHEPVLGAATSPILGQPFQVDLAAVPGGASSFCALGDSSASFFGLPLPLDLASIGAPGCSLLASHALTAPAAATGQGSGGGAASFVWPLPQNPALRGVHVYLQAIVLDAGANLFGLTTSNALDAILQ
jgi:hypothetical protein